MIDAAEFLDPARALGFRFWTGVPCSFLTPFINGVIDDPRMTYISSANEGDAVAAASGAALAGIPAVAMMQNSGLGNAVSPLTSLNWVFRIPVLLIVTLRGEPGLADEPQHELMGRITGHLLDELEIAWNWFPRHSDEVGPALAAATAHMRKTARPYAFVMRKGSVAPVSLRDGVAITGPRAASAPARGGEHHAALTRREALECVVDATQPEQTIVIGTTGYTGRELFALADRPNHLYLVGSMGCASSFGLGLSLALPDRHVLVVDGDGAALMRMGNFATVGAYGGGNFAHLLLDNGMHESTGGQPTVSPHVRFAAIAAACGYGKTSTAVSRRSLQTFLGRSLTGAAPSLLHLKTRCGVSRSLPRPDIAPARVCRRLMTHFGIETDWRDSG